MSFADGASAALESIHAAFATSLIDWEQGVTVASDIPAIPFHDYGESAFGMARAVNRLGFEVRADALPFDPANDDLLTVTGESAGDWRVIDVQHYPAAAAWRVFVEEA